MLVLPRARQAWRFLLVALLALLMAGSEQGHPPPQASSTTAAPGRAPTAMASRLSAPASCVSRWAGRTAWAASQTGAAAAALAAASFRRADRSPFPSGLLHPRGTGGGHPPEWWHCPQHRGAHGHRQHHVWCQRAHTAGGQQLRNAHPMAPCQVRSGQSRGLLTGRALLLLLMGRWALPRRTNT
jgi:hypothetical protein